ncbi:MAG: cache domain-containing protein [Candidatus Omnitrophica bacterium]|nr:cache domain-containing protein [Candidatus Omnitrophota bacterium]
MDIKHLSIKWKLLFISVFAVTVPTVIMGLASYSIHSAETYKEVKEKLGSIVSDWKVVTESYVQQKERVLKREEVLVKQRLETMDLVVNKILEILYAIDGNNPPEDKRDKVFDKIVSLRVGKSGFVALIDRYGNYLSKEQRKRYGDTMIQAGESGTIIRGIMEGAKRSGKGSPYSLSYPVKDSGGKEERVRLTVASWFEPLDVYILVTTYYTDFKSYELENLLQEELVNRMSRERIGANGYLWIVNSRGEYVVSKNKLRNGENILDTRDRTGRQVVKDIIAGAMSSPGKEPYYSSHLWRNVGEKEEMQRLSASLYIPEWDWVISAVSYNKDFLVGLGKIKMNIAFVSLIAIIISSLCAYYLTLMISRPIRVLNEIVIKASSGDLSVDVGGVKWARDEVGTLAESIEKMMISLAAKRRALEDKAKEEHRKAEELERAYAKLQDTQEKLVRSEKLAILGKLAGTVSHELRNPLGVIKNAVYFLKNIPTAGPGEEKTRKYLGIIDEEVNIAGNIISGIMAFSRAKEPELVKSSVNDIVNEHLKKAEIPSTIRVITFPGEGIPPVSVDRGQMNQVLFNVIMNAVQAMDYKGSLIISTEVAGRYAQISITDTGKGIPKDNMEKIFDPLFSTKVTGTGFGLSVCKSIMEKHGGDILVLSEPGKGATFTIRIPVG